MEQPQLFTKPVRRWIAVEPLVSLVWPGAPATKKTSNQVIYPGFRQYRSSARNFVGAMADLAEEALRAAREGDPSRIDHLARELRAHENRATAIVLPSKTFQKYERTALRATKKQIGSPVTILDPVIVEAHWYTPTLRMGDVCGYEQATADILQRAEVIGDDAQIERFHEFSHREKDKENPRTEIVVWSAEFREV